MSYVLFGEKKYHLAKRYIRWSYELNCAEESDDRETWTPATEAKQ